MNLKEKYATIKKQFLQARIENPALDARILLSDVCNLSHEDFVLQSDRALSAAEEKILDGFVAQRLQAKPIAKIIGQKEFYGRVFVTSEETLDPRPDSEVLVETILKLTRDKTGELRLLDLGTGTGCLILTLLAEMENATGVAVDWSDAALAVAWDNAQNLKLAGRITFSQSDWFNNVTGQFDVILSNPPYIPLGDIAGLPKDVRLYDPVAALDGGADGLAPYRVMIPQLPRFLKPGGIVAFEAGMGQHKHVALLLREAGFAEILIVPDLAGIKRVIVGIGLQVLPDTV